MRLKLATFNLNNLGRADVPDPTLYAAKLEYLAEVLSRIDADVVVVNEVREQESFEELAEQLRGYATRFLGDAPAERRRVQTGILARLEPSAQGQWHEYSAVLPGRSELATTLRFSRPVPWLRLETGKAGRLFVAGVHLKSWRAAYEDLPEAETPRRRSLLGRSLASAVRNAEAAGLRLLLDGTIDTGLADHYAVMGDFNDRLDSNAVALVSGLEDEDAAEWKLNEVRRLYPTGWWAGEGRRHSYVRHGRRELFDHILVSRGLSLQLVAAGAESQLLEPVHVRRYDNGGQYGRSDHAPVWAEFRLTD